MRKLFRASLCAVVPAALLFMQPALAAPTQTIERPPSFNAAQLPGIQRVGPNYTIENPVRSDGLLRDYVLKTPYGQFAVRGDEMVKMRIKELHALALLDKVSESDSFAKALVEAGLNPLKYTGQLITNPVDTVQNTLAGVGAMFDQIGAGLRNPSNTPDDPVSSVLGVTRERRQLAAAYGVDPYTDFPPLDAKLKQLSEAAALGGLSVNGALFVIPGAAGIVVSNLSTANTLNDAGIDQVARKYTAAQILEINRKLLATMGISPELSERLLANPHYTPIDMATMVAALDSMRGVEDRAVFVRRAAQANQRFVAYFVRRWAELLADDYHRHRDYVRFVSLDGYPYVLTREGRIAMLAPVDVLSWTKDVAAGFRAVTAARRRIAPKAHGEIRITGRATALAKRELKQEGWTVREHQ
jgi:hypothetical protein